MLRRQLIYEVRLASLCALIISLLVSSDTGTILWSRIESQEMPMFLLACEIDRICLVDHDSYQCHVDNRSDHRRFAGRKIVWLSGG